MSNLPDLDTASIGYIAYWNAIDQGGLSDVAPDEVLSAANIQSYTLYDNGVQGQYQTVGGRDCTFRVKSDGWFVAWFDRTTTYTVTDQGAENIAGRHDVVNNWASFSDGDMVKNALERSIHSLWNELSNSADVTYIPDDSGLYNYDVTSATTTTLLSASHGQNSGGGDYGQSYTDGFLYTSSTNTHVADFYFAIDRSAHHGTSGDARITFDGTVLIDSANYSQTDDSEYYGAFDLLNDNLIPNADTEYPIQSELYSRGASYGQYGKNQIGVVALWS